MGLWPPELGENPFLLLKPHRSGSSREWGPCVQAVRTGTGARSEWERTPASREASSHQTESGQVQVEPSTSSAQNWENTYLSLELPSPRDFVVAAGAKMITANILSPRGPRGPGVSSKPCLYRPQHLAHRNVTSTLRGLTREERLSQRRLYAVLKVNMLMRQVQDSKLSDISPRVEPGFLQVTQSKAGDGPYNTLGRTGRRK